MEEADPWISMMSTNMQASYSRIAAKYLRWASSPYFDPMTIEGHPLIIEICRSIWPRAVMVGHHFLYAPVKGRNFDMT